MSLLNLPEVTLLITHYNRSRSLGRLLKALAEQEITFGEIIVSDDGSKQYHLDYVKILRNQYHFTLIPSPVNKGLGNNINKGQQAVKTPYTLYIQEDFVPKPGFVVHFTDALNLLKQDTSFDIARFYSYFSYPYLKKYKKGFSEMLFNNSPVYANHLKFYMYSDHPHLRRSDFLRKFGTYKEGVKGDKTEFLMALSFIKHNGRGLFYDNFNDLFWQKNTPGEPSMMYRAKWRQSKNSFVLGLRHLYLRFKLLKATYEVLRRDPDTSF